MERIESNRQTRLLNSNTRSSLSIYGKLSRTWPFKSYRHTKNDNNTKRHRYNKYLYTIATIGSLLSPNVALAADVGGVSATANPIANSSGSVTNQAIQVLQGPYITNTYGNGIQCQGATMNVTPYVTGGIAFKRPYEAYYDEPVYNMVDADDDGVPDNPGEILYYMPTRTNQSDNYNVSVGVSATWSRPLDKKLQEQCKQAAQASINQMVQLTANKRLDFELARLKNCGELKKAGVMFHPKSPYYSVCADVMLVQPAGVVTPHMHSLGTNQVEPPKEEVKVEIKANGNANDLGTFSIGNVKD